MSDCYVDDMTNGLVALMDTPPEITGPVNLGNRVDDVLSGGAGGRA